VTYFQLFSRVAIDVVVLAMLGMLSPASRGALMTAGIFIFMFMGFVATVSLPLLLYSYHCYYMYNVRELELRPKRQHEEQMKRKS